MATRAKTPRDAPLAAYRKRRHADRTPEPMGDRRTRRRPRASDRPTFVIQEHHARSLHWDFRLERDGVLVSWALPKGLPVDPAVNHLAVHTEDHPLEYGGFEGEIPAGEYGAGEVTIWDRGTYDLETWRDDEVKVTLHGARANGRHVLFRTHGTNWMIHRMDPPREGYVPMPESISPMLCTPGGPDIDPGDGWAVEFKWDGVRAVVYVDGGRVRALTRNGKDLVATFPELRDIGEHLGSRTAIVDGEIVALDDAGRPSFGRLAPRLHVSSKSAVARLARTTPANFLAFDLLYLDGTSLLDRTYDERRRALEGLALSGDTFATPPALTDASGERALAIARERGLEGVVFKRRDSVYSPGRRSGDWIKVKNVRNQEVVIGGWTEGQNRFAGSLGALLLGVPGDDGLDYVGKVGTGFSDDERRELREELESVGVSTTPFAQRLSPVATRTARFVRPEIVGEVTFTEWTRDGHLRHPSWRGRRTDKSPDEVRRES